MVSTAWAMTVATIQLFVIAVLAADLIEDLGITRWQIGVLGAVNTGIGAVTAPRLGRLADRLGAGRAMGALVATSGAGLLVTAAATNYWLLVVASAVTGLPQGACNPVTNKVIAGEVPARQQGSVTGVKQSGVQFAVFLAGATLPTSAATVGWRLAVAAFAAFTLVTAAVLVTRFPTAEARSIGGGGRPERERARSQATVSANTAYVHQVAVYAFLLGVCAGGVTRFYPLFAHEVLGYSEATAGLAVSVAGLTAIVARIVWAKVVESAMGSRTALVVQGVGSAGALLLLFVAEDGLRWLLWPAVVVMAFTVVAWNVVAMLAVIRSVPAELSGRATGVVLMGFLGGLTFAAPLVGWSVDRLGSYRPSWVALAVLGLLGAATVARGRDRDGSEAGRARGRSADAVRAG
jgi:predicted MFS family arabinose efflux permease